MSDNKYWDEATERAYWDACAQEEAAMREKDDEIITRGEARNLAYEILNHFMYADFLEITPADIDKKVDAIPAVPREMTAREYEKAIKTIVASHDLSTLKAWQIACEDKDWEKAVEIIEKWAREYPEERSEE